MNSTTKSTIYPLFAQPVVACAPRLTLTAEEGAFLSALEMVDNVGNSMSESDAVLDHPAMQRIRTFVDEQLFNYKKNLLRIKDETELYVTQSWVNVARPGQFHPRHKHPNSIVSGVLFFDDNRNQDLPPIRFHRASEALSMDFDYDELNDFNASCREIDPESGLLILFPSQLEHDVGTNESDRSRSSLSFNTFVRGPVGGKRQLTAVAVG